MKEKRNTANMKIFYMIMPVLTLCMLFVKGKVVKAAEMQQISMNAGVVDSLSADDEEKYYKFTMDTDGYFTINFSKVNPTVDVGRGWNVILYDISGNELTSVSKKEIKTSYTSAKLDFKKGTQLYVKIECYNHWSEPVGQSFNLEIKSVRDNSWEQEDNNSVNAATVLSTGVAKKGTTWKDDDEDYYVYTVEKQGYFTVDIIREDLTANIGRGYWLTLYDNKGKWIDEYKGITTNLTTNKYNFMVGDKVYFKIDNYNHWSEPVGAVYSIRVNNVEDRSWEKENRAGDDSSLSEMTAANNILSSTPIKGHIWTNKDRDVYKYNLPSDGIINLTFNVNNDSSKLGGGYDISFIDSSGKEINTFYRITSDQVLKQDMLAGVCYIKVWSHSDWSEPLFNEYTISASYTKGLSFTRLKAAIKKPKLIKDYRKKRYVDVNWTKTEGASGYKIYRSTKKNKGYKCVGTVTNNYSTSWRDSKVKKKKTYYYKIRAYQDFYGKNIYTKYSSVKKIKVK